jgi:hypothetical protein
MDDTRLEQLLAYPEETLTDDFTREVMRRVRRQQRLRRAVLWGTGVIGAGFGLLGASLLSEPLARAFTDLGPLTVSLGAVLTTGFLVWLLSDETSSTG